MPSGEPLWYCHECHAEMRPLMTPEPMCASCHGGFIEKMENPADDPREFAHADDGGLFDGPEPPPGLDTFLMGLQALMDRGINNNNQPDAARAQARPDGSPATSRFSFQVRSNNGTRTMSFGSPTIGNLQVNNRYHGARRNSGTPPTASEFLGPRPHGQPGPGGDRITGPMMAQYLLALLGNRDPLSAMFAGGAPGGPDAGRMGDYVFNQEALDQIITQLMEQSNAHRPVPATEEIMAKLPREILMEDSHTLELDCAVCKEQFALGTEDPDEQIVVTLPCKHPFHEPCIIPWLKSSGTCPVCRYALIPQPSQSGTPAADPAAPSTSANPPPIQPAPARQSSSSSSTNQNSGSGSGGGFISSLLGAFGHHPSGSGSGSSNSANSSSRQPPTSPPRSPRSPPTRSSTWSHGTSNNHYSSSRSSPRGSSNSNSNHNNNNNSPHLPGGWADDLD